MIGKGSGGVVGDGLFLVETVGCDDLSIEVGSGDRDFSVAQ